MGGSIGEAGRRPRGRAAGPLVAAVVITLAVACAPKQRIPLDLGPGAVELYVDGERAEGVPQEVELRSDRDHKLFVKRPGYVPELIVLETQEVDGAVALEPPEVRIRLHPMIGDRQIQIEEAEPRPTDRQP